MQTCARVRVTISTDEMKGSEQQHSLSKLMRPSVLRHDFALPVRAPECKVSGLDHELLYPARREVSSWRSACFATLRAHCRSYQRRRGNLREKIPASSVF